MQGGIQGGLVALEGRRALESRGVRQCRFTVHLFFTIHILFYPFTNTQRIGTIVENGVPHFLENGPRMFWREHTMSSSRDPNQAQQTQADSTLLASICGDLPHPAPFWLPKQRHWGWIELGQSFLFICISIFKLCCKAH